jgi:hypothetical protein
MQRALAYLLITAVIPLAACTSQGPGAAAPGVADATTMDATTREQPVVPGRPARVFVFAGVGRSCEPLPPPQLTITAPPAQGEVTFRPDQETTIAASAQGTCLGTRARGTGVYYTARAGAAGADRFSIAARLATGETATRTFEVRIAE